jgi:hypothetical protein
MSIKVAKGFIAYVQDSTGLMGFVLGGGGTECKWWPHVCVFSHQVGEEGSVRGRDVLAEGCE